MFRASSSELFTMVLFHKPVGPPLVRATFTSYILKLLVSVRNREMVKLLAISGIWMLRMRRQ